MSQRTVEVERRENTGKNANRRLRRADQVPAVVYGGDRDPVPIQVNQKTIHNLLRAGTGENTVLLLKLAGTDRERPVMTRDLQYHPLTGELLHIDFQRIEMTDTIRVKVPIDLEGVPFGVKTEGGMLDFITRDLEIQCLPARIPSSLTIDVSDLHVGRHVEAKDIELPEGVELVGEPERVIASVAHRRAGEAVDAEEEGEELLEAEKDEPEVIRRGKTEEED